MDYTIDIIDTKTETVLTNEKAVANSPVLQWKGGDKKDELFIMGSSLSFTLVGMSCQDLQYADLFTGDETRFKVIMYTPDATLWSGFILPDQYSEPYQDSPILIDFTAADGLGRLKGKYLPEDFYDEEKSVIDIIAKCLELTGLELDFRFAPAIENWQNKDYDLIYIDTRDYLEKDKKKDAYSILEELAKSMLLTIYQADNVWNIEGFNVRNFRVYTTKLYNLAGEFIAEQEITRLSKDITGIATPIITMQPPYGVLDVTHKRVDISFPETLAEEENDGWVLSRGTFHYIYATDWFGYGGLNAKAAEYKDDNVNPFLNRANYQVYVEVGDPNGQFIALRNRPYLIKGNKYKINLDFRILPYEDVTDATKEININQGLWTNPFYVTVRLLSSENGATISDTLFSNRDTVDADRYIEQAFAEDEIYKNELTFIANKNGVLDISISAVKDNGQGEGVGRIEYAAIEEATIETIAFEDEYRSNIILNEDYTVKKEIELPYADDSTGFSKGFRLKKLREKQTYNELDVNVLRGFARDGWNYIVVPLQGANAVKENPDQLYSGTVNIQVEDVIYNFNNSDDHVIKSTNPVTAGILKVRVYDYNTIREDREYWQQWSDSIYKVEKLRYTDVVANIYNRLFNIPIPKVDFNVKNNVKINDFINFNFVSDKQWILTNCKWIIDKGITNVTAIQSYYAVKAGQNIPPVVEAGNDITIVGGQFEFELTSEAFDPDGFIVQYTWRELTDTGSIIANPNDQNVNVTNFTADYGLFEVEVIDNDGAPATDTVEIFRNQEHELTLTRTLFTSTDETYEIGFNPNISEGAALNIKGQISCSITITQNNQGYAYVRILIDGVERDFIRVDYNQQGYVNSKVQAFSINYFNGDIITFEIGRSALTPDSAYAEFKIETIDFVEGQGTITGIPQTRFLN